MQILERIAIIAVLNLIFFYKTLSYGYVGDDVERAERKEPIFKSNFHRWWIQFIGLRHLAPQVAHFISLVVHTICCVAIYLALGRNNISFLAAILFSIHPMNIQGSVWISGRNYVTASILSLGMIAFPTFSWLFYMTTSHFAVNAWFAPLIFLGTKYWYMIGIIPLVWLIDRTNRATLHRKMWETGGLKTTNTEMRAVKLQKIIPYTKTFLYYITLGIFPHTIGIEHTYLRGFGTNKTDNDIGYKMNKIFWVGVLLLGILGFNFIRCMITGWTPFWFGLFWYFINISMWCNFVTYQQHITERYAYLANIGLVYSLASILINYPIAMGVFIVGYMVRLWYVMDMYRNDYWAVEYTIAESKNMYYMWLMRGVKKFCAKDYVGAIYDFNEAYNHKNYDLKVLYNIAVTSFVLGDTNRAKEFLGKAKENVYDELDEDVKPTFKGLEDYIKVVEEARAKGETQIQIDLSRLSVVK